MAYRGKPHPLPSSEAVLLATLKNSGPRGPVTRGILLSHSWPCKSMGTGAFTMSMQKSGRILLPPPFGVSTAGPELDELSGPRLLHQAPSPCFFSCAIYAG